MKFTLNQLKKKGKTIMKVNIQYLNSLEEYIEPWAKEKIKF
jgi:hypothetical protein